MRRLVGWCAILIALVSQPVLAGAIDWNDAGIRWRPWAKALAEAKQSQKPICLVFYVDWCGHCRNYGKVFYSPKIVEAARSFVMVRLDSDLNPRLSQRFTIDGKYVPRTFFLASDGSDILDVQAPRDDFRSFYDPDRPESLLEGMRAATRHTSSR